MTVCGHINRHSKDIANQFDNLACEKDYGHGGNHGAMHIQRVSNESGIIVIGKQKYSEDKVWCEWTDAAGVEASKIVPLPLPVSEQEAERIKFVNNLVGPTPKGTIVG